MDQFKLFIDLDGVLANFEQGVQNLGISNKSSEMWFKLSEIPNFFGNLEWCVDGLILWEFIKKYNPTVLTGLPLGNWAEPQKRDWCSRNLGDNVNVICCKSKEKSIKAKEHLLPLQTMILIDDSDKFKSEWISQGGIFIHHTNTECTIEKFKEVIKNGVEEPKSEDVVKILFIGDPHFKIKNVECIPLFTSKILNIVAKSKLDFVVVAGDLLDNHDRVDVEPLNLAIEFINSLRLLIKTFVLVGNHDYKNNQQFLTNHHWMNVLKFWENVVIVDDITTFEVKNLKFLFAPYIPPGRFIEALETKISQKHFTNFKAVFAHQEFYGCKMGPIESKHGDKWKSEYPIVISGHIHNKQWVQDNIYYPGSAMQHAFGQSVENTVSIISLSENEIICEEEDLKMPKLIIKYMTVSDVMNPESKITKYKNTEFKKYKIVLQGNPEEFQTFKKNLKYKQLLLLGFKITFKSKVVMATPTLNSIESKKNFLDILNEKIKEEKDPGLQNIFEKFVLNF